MSLLKGMGSKMSEMPIARTVQSANQTETYQQRLCCLTISKVIIAPLKVVMEIDRCMQKSGIIYCLQLKKKIKGAFSVSLLVGVGNLSLPKLY